MLSLHGTIMKKIKILVVEDETIVALDIKHALIRLDFEVTDTVTNYDDALLSAKSQKPDLLLTDIHLEHSKSGIEIARDIQTIAPIPIIYLTAFSDDATIHEAVKTEPVSYMLKPFKRDELKSNIMLAMYKMNQSKEKKTQKQCISLGHGFYFEPKERTLYFEEMSIKLSTKENEFLSLLIEANGKLVTFETLEHFLWPEAPVSQSTLRTFIYRLRTKLEHKLIETVPSIGCKLKECK